MTGLKPSDAVYMLRAMRSGIWSPVPADAPITHVLDVGAHVGYFSLWARIRWPAAEVVAVEPDPTNCAHLRNNVHNMDVAAVEIAFGRRAVSLVAPERHTTKLKYRPSDIGTIRAVTLAEMLTWFTTPPQQLLVKMDIEGGEHALMDDPGLGVEVLQSAAAVALEIHHPRDKMPLWFQETLSATHDVRVASRHRHVPNCMHAVRKGFL